ncbi:hypothetical protein [Streptacidiphilus fuscans]|uniref:Uncharacterized protein n=1 Tax=Streptacidiphilus fuscans TaxID=2789292 RepID=A0A931B911_9ACTN|nr:hypothetical protein [Streptacidiphilus fuscans]MBF9071722.1 hypothetical protein [Streptacidiphilus fuscans]
MNDDAATPADSPLVPLVPLLQLPGLPTPTGGDVPVCGPDGCAVPQREQPDEAARLDQD